MNEDNFIKLKPKGDPYSDSIRAKLKGSASDKRKMAQRIAGLKRSKPETIEQKAMQLVANPKVSSLEIMRMIQVLKERTDLPDTLQVMLIGKAIDAHKAIFGTRSFNVNMELSPESSKSIHEIYLEVLQENNESNTNNESDGEGTTEESSEGEKH